MIRHGVSIGLAGGDIVPFAISEDGDVEITARPCLRSARMRVFDLDAVLEGKPEDVSSGNYGLYSLVNVPGLSEGVYAIAVDYPDGSVCDGRNCWIAGFSGPLTDPVTYVGPFKNKSDFSMTEDLNVDDLLGEIIMILQGGQ